MTAWLVNDSLGQLGEKTFWHDLLEWFPELKFKGYSFDTLRDRLHMERGDPDFIIRNATYFPWLDHYHCPVISFVQDIVDDSKLRDWQAEVIDKSDIVVMNSISTEIAADVTDLAKTAIIPIGTDKNLFRDYGVHRKNKPLLFVGSKNKVKGFDILQELINALGWNYNWNVVLKDAPINVGPNVRCYSRVSQPQLCEIMNESSVLVCTSRRETQHLAGIEAGFTNLPIVAPDVGIYRQLVSSEYWGKMVFDTTMREYEEAIEDVLSKDYNVRDHFLNLGLDKESCRCKWTEVINEIRN